MPEEDRTSSLPPAEVADPSTHCEARMSWQGWAAGFQRWRRSSGSQPRLCAADAPARSFGPRRVVSLYQHLRRFPFPRLIFRPFVFTTFALATDRITRKRMRQTIAGSKREIRVKDGDKPPGTVVISSQEGTRKRDSKNAVE